MQVIKKIRRIVVLLLAIGTVMLGATDIVQLIMDQISQWFQISMTEDCYYSWSGAIGVVIASIVVTLFDRKRVRKVQEPFHWKTAAYYGIFVICFCQIIVSFLTSAIFAHLLPDTTTVKEITGIAWQVHMFLAIIVAPISEEYLFRKYMYSHMCEEVSKPIAMLCCSMIFAACHGYQLQGFLSCFFAGMVFTYIYDQTNSVRYSIIAHMLCNLEVFVYHWLEKQQITIFGKELVYEVNGYVSYHIGVFVFACTAVIIMAVIKKQKKSKVQGELMKGVAYVSDFSSR